MTDLQKARDAATELEDAFNKECDRVYGNAKLWPAKTADALMSARLYASRVRQFLGATNDPESEAVAEARKEFAEIEGYTATLAVVYADNPDISLAIASLQGLL